MMRSSSGFNSNGGLGIVSRVNKEINSLAMIGWISLIQPHDQASNPKSASGFTPAARRVASRVSP